MSYQPAIYRAQGGASLVVTTGGTVTQQGTLTNSGTIANTGAITNTGTITNSSDGVIKDTVTAHVAAATINAYGISSIGSTTAGARAYKLPRAAQGTHKYIHIKGCTAGGITLISATAAGSSCFFERIKTVITAKTAAATGMTLHLVAATSKIWSIVGYSTAAGTYTCT